MESIILFNEFEFPKIKGLEYLINTNQLNSDYLFINDVNDFFSIHFEKDFPTFIIPKNSELNYSLFEFKKDNKKVKFFCPNRPKNINSTVWYFNIEIIDDDETHVLPGQICVILDKINMFQVKSIPKFIDILEKIKIYKKFNNIN